MNKKQTSNPRVHFVVGSGSYGCLYDNGPHAHTTLAAAVDDLATLFELGRVRRARLKRDRYLKLDGSQSPIEQAQGVFFGADYAEITECSCSSPWEHNEDNRPDDWPEYTDGDDDATTDREHQS